MPLLFFILGLALAVPARAGPQSNKLNPEDAFIVEVVLSDSTKMHEAMEVYPDGDDWWVPLAELTDSLDLSIQIDPQATGAKGFIIQDDRKFTLALGTQCEAFYDERVHPVPCDDMIPKGEEIYVRRARLEKWLPLNLIIKPYRSQLVVNPREKLPIQLRREREAEAARVGGTDLNFDPGYPKVEIPRSVLSFPFLDFQAGYNRHFTSGTAQNELRYDTTLSGELFEAEAQGFLSGDEHSITSSKLHLARREPNGMGALKLTEVQFFDVLMPQIPLIVDGTEGRGVVASSFPLNQPISFESTDLDGPLPPGWEVLLYRNGVLVDRKLSNGTGRYFFQKVRLAYGLNELRLAFFGPRGERREETKTYNITPSILRPGETNYRLAFGILNDTRQRFSVQAATNLFRHFTLTSGFVNDQDPNNLWGYAGLTGLNELFLFNTTCAIDKLGGKACEWGQQFALGDVSLSTKYTRLFHFRSEIFNNLKPGEVEQNAELSALLSHTVPIDPLIGMMWETTKKNYVDGTSLTSLKNYLSFAAGGLQWTNQITYALGSNKSVSGTWEVSYVPNELRLTFGNDYTEREISSLNAQAQLTVDNEYSLSGRLRYFLASEQPTIQVSAARFLDILTLGVNGTFTSKDDYSAGVTLSTSLIREPHSGGLIASAKSVSQTGSASVLVFLDKNRDGLRDPGEKAIPGIVVFANPKRAEKVTNDAGVAYFPNLEPYQAADISISVRALEDPHLRPAFRGVRVYPRAGKCAEILLPMHVVGEVDGNIRGIRAGNSGPVRRVPMELVDEEQNVLYRSRTDMDGFYLFEGVPAGAYYARIAPSFLRTKSWKAQPNFKKVTIAETGSFSSGIDFNLVGY